MTRIMRGVLNFQNLIFGEKEELFQKLSKGQQPLALFITCSDSRIIPDMLAQTEPGELFVLRNAGNLVPPHEAGSGAEAATIEYAVVQLHVRDIIVCGHSKCGAMHGLLEPDALKKMPSVAGWLRHAQGVLEKLPVRDSLAEEDRLARAIEENVLLQLEHIKTHPAVREGIGARSLRLHGWVYHFEKGKVETYDPALDAFVPLEKEIHRRLVENAEKERGALTEWDTHI
jgi:carbonic anhydrase